MHLLQPKTSRLKKAEIDELLVKFNISLSQLPKIASDDPGIPADSKAGDVIKFERKTDSGTQEYLRVVI
jgi:DNA-directed RNA polymerase subunit H (RpoH/RPB5)